jgi:hypothetical protein
MSSILLVAMPRSFAALASVILPEMYQAENAHAWKWLSQALQQVPCLVLVICNKRMYIIRLRAMPNPLFFGAYDWCNIVRLWSVAMQMSSNALQNQQCEMLARIWCVLRNKNAVGSDQHARCRQHAHSGDSMLACTPEVPRADDDIQ